MTSKICICMGDGGIDAANPLMDLYILAQTKKKKPKVCFLPTASGDNGGVIAHFYKTFNKYSCETRSIHFFNPQMANIEDYVLSSDCIYVGGGQSKSMLGVWREWGMDKILKKAYDNGVVLAGGSAGSVCWFDQCITDSIPGSLTVMKCLGILPFSNCPHYASQTRRSAYTKFVAKQEIKAGYAADDYAALHFVNGQLYRSLSNRPYAKTYSVSFDNQQLNVKKLPTTWLGYKENQNLAFHAGV